MAEMCALEICSTIHRGPICPEKKIHLSVYCLYHLRYITLVGYWSLAVFSFVAARRKAAEGKRRIKTEEEELAGMFTYTMHTRMISLLDHSVAQPTEYTVLIKYSYVKSIHF